MDMTPFAGYSCRYAGYGEPVCDPESVRVFRGILIAAPLAALLWVPILWAIL